MITGRGFGSTDPTGLMLFKIVTLVLCLVFEFDDYVSVWRRRLAGAVEFSLLIVRL